MTHSQTRQPTTFPHSRTRDEIAAILEEYSASALGQQEFADRVGIGRSTLQYWLRRARQGGQLGTRRRGKNKEQRSSLIEVDLNGGLQSGGGEARYELEAPNGLRLRIANAFDDQEVRRLLSLMKEVW